MSDKPVTVDQASSCLSLLQGAGGAAMTAARIAELLDLGGIRETQRRHVRAIIEHLRAGDCKIIADAAGYRLTGDEKEWRDYLDSRQIGAKAVLGCTHQRRRESLRASSGQKTLFGSGGLCGRSN